MLEALKYYKLSAKLNNPHALIKLGLFYYKGEYCTQNIKYAIKCFELAANHPKQFDANYKQGVIYSKGKY